MLKRDRISIVQAQSCIRAYQEIPIRFLDVGLEQSLEIVEQLRIYAYDTYLIQCAQKTKTPLITLDNRLISAAKSMGIE